MDRRQQKSREAIFKAFTSLLERRKFNEITVQEIIDEANVGRTTFYAHFESKDMLLKEMCSEIFDHIFSHELSAESSHDFSNHEQSLKEKLTHLLYHLKDNKGNILGLLTGDSSELFMRYFKELLEHIFTNYLEYFSKGVPTDFVMNHMVGSFAEAVKWWAKHETEKSPEEVASFYMKMLPFRTDL